MKKMAVAKILSEVSGVTVSGRGENWEVETTDDAQADLVLAKLRTADISVGGFRCGHGGWVLRPGYQACHADYCDPSSSIHY